MKDNDEGFNKFVLKIPYTTNQSYHPFDGFDKLNQQFKCLRKQWMNAIPCICIQPYLENKMEYAVVCINGNAIYEATIGNRSKCGGNKKAFSNWQ